MITSRPQQADVTTVHISDYGRGPRTLVACPDARPPAYEAAVGLAESGRLAKFRTSFYFRENGPLAHFSRRRPKFRRYLERRQHKDIPSERVRSAPLVDASLALESRLGRRFAGARHAAARLRTRYFDRLVADDVVRDRPDVTLLFSDVGSEFALPACARVGTRSVLSMVHGDVREEQKVLTIEEERAPDFFPIYLADGPVDRRELDWLHERRLRDIALADLILVPSEHIARVLVQHGTPRQRLRVIPYAADTTRFVPVPSRSQRPGCRFLFAGGITQRKGIKDLFEAWRLIKRPGWTLSLLGGLPYDPSPLRRFRDDVEWLGRVGHAEVPQRMADADVFVFPSLFEGSAVVTYEALACGLPIVTTPEAGSIARDGQEGILVPARDHESLAERMEQLGLDHELRAEMSIAARSRAEEFDWKRYHRSLNQAVRDVVNQEG